MGNFEIPECNSNQEAIILLQTAKCQMQDMLATVCPQNTLPLSIIDVVQTYLDPKFDTNNFEEYKALHNKKTD